MTSVVSQRFGIGLEGSFKLQRLKVSEVTTLNPLEGTFD